MLLCCIPRIDLCNPISLFQQTQINSSIIVIPNVFRHYDSIDPLVLHNIIFKFEC